MPHEGDVHTFEDDGSANRFIKKDFTLKRAEVPVEKAAKTRKIQWIHSSFDDQGSAWNRADFYDEAGALIHQVKVDEY